MTVWAKYRVRVDWDRDGSFAGTYDDITADLRGRVSWRYGRDYASQISGRNPSAGTFQCELDNSAGKYSTFNTGSPIYGKTLPNRPVQLQMSTDGGSNWTTMWQGFMESLQPQPTALLKDARALLKAIGPFSALTAQDVLVSMHTSIATGAAIEDILDQIGWPVGLQNIDTGQTTMQRWWSDEESALQALQDVADTDAGFIREGKDGSIIFEDRSHRFNSPHDTAQATYTNDVSGNLRMAGAEQEDILRDVYNFIEMQVQTFNLSEEMVLWTYINIYDDATPGTTDPPVVPAGGTLTLWAEFPSENGNVSGIAVNEWTLLSWLAYENDDGSGEEMSPAGTNVVTCDNSAKYSNRMKMIFTNTDSKDAYITKLVASGTAVLLGDPTIVSKEDASSIADFGKRKFPYPSKYSTSIEEATNRCDYLLNVYKTIRPIVTVGIAANHNSYHMAEVKDRDVSDRIHITYTNDPCGLYLDDDFFVEAIEHQLVASRLEKESTYEHIMLLQCAAVSGADWSAFVKPYTPTTIPAPTTAAAKVPDDLWATGWYAPPFIYAKCLTWKYNVTVTEAEMRAKWFDLEEPGPVDLRTVAEGGTFVGGSWDEIAMTGISASELGCVVRWLASANIGKWFFAFRFKNSTGWSVWTDGNDTPEVVSDLVDMTAKTYYDTDKVEDWTVWMTPGPSNSVICHASRPKIQGEKITNVAFHLRDAILDPDPTFDQLDDDNDPPETTYDGTSAAHKYNNKTGVIMRTDESTGGWGTADENDIVLIDVRDNGNFGVDYCFAGTIKSAGDIDTDSITIQKGMFFPVTADSGEGTSEPIWTNLRIKIVKPWWFWNTEGYLGGTGDGWWSMGFLDMDQRGDILTEEFISDPIPIPQTVDFFKLAVRAIFTTDYSMTDGRIWTVGCDVAGYEVRLPDAAVIGSDCRLVDTQPRKMFFVQMESSVGATRQIGTPTNPKHRQPFAFIMRQPQAGGLEYTFTTAFRFSQKVPVIPSTNPYAQDYIGLVYDAYDMKFDVVSFVPGFEGFGSFYYGGGGGSDAVSGGCWLDGAATTLLEPA